MLGVGEPEHVTGEFQDHVLKTATGSKTRYEILPRHADGSKGARQTLVRTARSNPETVCVQNVGFLDGRSRDPSHRDFIVQLDQRMTNRGIGCAMRFTVWIVFA